MIKIKNRFWMTFGFRKFVLRNSNFCSFSMEKQQKNLMLEGVDIQSFLVRDVL